MIYIAQQSEYSFKQCFYHLQRLVDDAVSNGEKAIGVADFNTTFAHAKLEQMCNKAKIKPIFGVWLAATDTVKPGTRSFNKSCNYVTKVLLIAKNQDGLIEINKLVTTAWQQFYYAPRVNNQQVFIISDSVFVLAEHTNSEQIKARVDFVIVANQGIIKLFDKPLVCVPVVKYPEPDDKPVYSVLSGRNSDMRTFPCHRLSVDELLSLGVSQESIDITELIADQCNATIKHDKMVRFYKDVDLCSDCIRRAESRGVDLSDDVYLDRFNMELEQIYSRDFQDYFLIVADILDEAKKTGLVGPGRGSSGGSLVCYIMSITEMDPIEHGLLFARFIDIHREGLPDIDSDIPDIKRTKAIKYIKKRYGQNNVMSLGTISKLKAKSAISLFAKELKIPIADSEEVKNNIVERSMGDARSQMCIDDTLTGTEAGKAFITAYPEISVVSKAEGHASHSGKHAAGVIVSNEPLYNYVGINSREESLMIEGKQAESIGLLKIDVLGLRTLTILQETSKLAGFDFHDYYSLELNCSKAFDILTKGRTTGIFQFDGRALAILTSQMGISSFKDICAITALGRPGALNTGSSAKYVKCRTGASDPEWLGGVYDEITKDTYGLVIYQEQTMRLLKDYGNLSWEDVNMLRRAMSKSMGDEYFSKYKDKFIGGSIENGYSEGDAIVVWAAIASSGSYGFNLSHAVAYSIISYWTAWAKAHHPLEFAAANLNHTKDKDSAIRLLRDFVVNDGIEYNPIDPDESMVEWTINNGKLLGGLTSIDGIGVKKAQSIIKARNGDSQYTPSMALALLNPKTAFDILFPAEYYFGKLYSEPEKFGLDTRPVKISEIDREGEYTIIGILRKNDLRDRNDVQAVIKRGGEKVTRNQYYLNLMVEDDTSTIRCSISPIHFDDMDGHMLCESINIDETWLLIRGKVRDEWHSISIDAIINLNNTIGLNAAREQGGDKL